MVYMSPKVKKISYKTYVELKKPLMNRDGSFVEILILSRTWGENEEGLVGCIKSLTYSMKQSNI